ncbi:MAG: diguanylate cyclase [Bryobacteraceae bacterium]|nr:diguanylate cyclase [Bryobacteraceae bacterium]
MSSIARLYIAAVSVAGYGWLLLACAQAQDLAWLPLLACLVMVVLASPLKVALPGVAGTLSINYMVSLLAMGYLSEPGVLLVAAAGSLTQCLWKTRQRPQWVQTLFSIAGTIVSAGAAYQAFHHGTVRTYSDNSALLYFVASLTYFLVNTALISLVISLTAGHPILRHWYENFLFTAPQYLICAVLAWAFSIVYESLGWEVAILLLPTAYLIERSYSIYLRRLGEQEQHTKRMAELHLRTIKALALAIDAKDETTHDHLRRMQVYSTEIARELGLNDDQIQALNAAALLHDIGKLAVPEYIISKPGKLTAEEFEKMKVHPAVGAEILEAVDFPYPVVPIVRSHHERWDGSGYPDGLRGEAIPIGARILAVVDSLDALASDRQYRAGLPLEEAIAVIAQEGGRTFDPRVVDIVTRRYADFEQKTKAALPTVTRVRSFRGATHVETINTSGGGPNTSDLTQMNFTLSIAAARQEIQTLLEVTRDIGTSLSIDDTFSLLAGRLKNIVPHDSLAIYIHEAQVLRPEYVTGLEAKLFGSLEIPVGQGLSGWVFEKQQPIINGSPSVEPGYLNDPSKFSTLRSALAVPLEGVDGAIGALALYSAEAEAFTQDHLRLLLAISSKSGTAIENALRFKQAQRSAATDELTGLPNARSLFLHLDSEVKAATAGGTTLSVLVTDLDGFKAVNDHFGHLEGNRLLQLTAQGLRQLCRGADYVARMGGDEFVVILRGATPDAVARRITQMREMVQAQGLAVTGRECVSLSVGQSSFPEDAASAELLLDIADKRMFALKQELYRSGKKKRGEMFTPVA